MSESSVEAEPAAAAGSSATGSTSRAGSRSALAEHGEERGLIGPLEPPRLWTRHVLNSAVARAAVPRRASATSGSGAGLPGLVLAIARPDVEWVLIEPMERRVAWLSEQVEALGLENVEVRARTR